MRPAPRPRPSALGVLNLRRRTGHVLLCWRGASPTRDRPRSWSSEATRQTRRHALMGQLACRGRVQAVILAYAKGAQVAPGRPTRRGRPSVTANLYQRPDRIAAS